jgi:hypothetical protein
VSAPELLEEWLFDQLVGVTYVGIAYREAGTDPAPASLDAACCGDRVCFFSRTQQGVHLVASEAPFPVLPDPYVDFKLTLDAQFFQQIQAGASAPSQLDCAAALCAALVSGRSGAPPWRGVPPVNLACVDIPFPVLPLARVTWRRFVPDPAAPQILTVDNCTFRPLAPGMPALRAMVDSLLNCATPAFLAPRIAEVSPPDGAEVSSSDTVPSATTPLVLVARTNARVHLDPAGDPDAGNLWEIVFYPANGADIVRFTSSGTGSTADGPGGSKVRVTLADTADGTGTEITLAFSDEGGSLSVAPFTPGTYVWTLSNGDDNSAGTSSVFRADTTDIQLDGEPNPAGAVPSGDGVAGGAFQARFFIRV